MKPMPCSAQYGRISCCIRRSNMFQPYCTTSTLRTALQALISSSLKFDRPTKRTLPACDHVVEAA